MYDKPCIFVENHLTNIKSMCENSVPVNSLQLELTSFVFLSNASYFHTNIKENIEPSVTVITGQKCLLI